MRGCSSWISRKSHSVISNLNNLNKEQTMQELVLETPDRTFPREIPEDCCPAVRAYLTQEGVLVPVGHPGHLTLFRVPCPKKETATTGHWCRMWRFESRFECSCDFKGDYWVYAAACRKVTPVEAHKMVLQEMEVADVDAIRDSLAGQSWHEKKVARLIQLPNWVPPIPITPAEGRHIPRWEHPAARGAFPEQIESRKAEWQEQHSANAKRFEQSRELLETAVTECLTQISRSERHTLLTYFRLGETLNRLESVCKRELLREHPGDKWSEFLSRLANRSERYIRQALRIFRSVEFIWQLEPFHDVKQFLDAVASASSPRTQIAVYKDGQTRHTLTLQQKFQVNQLPSATVTIELKDGELASAMKGLDPTAPPGEHARASTLGLTIVDKLMKICVWYPDATEDLLSLIEAISSVCRMSTADVGDLFGRIAASLEDAAESKDVPEWIGLLPQRRERDRKKRPNPPVESLPGSNYEADLREWVHDMAEAEDE